MFMSPGPIIVQIGGFSLRWYGLLISVALLVGIQISQRLAKQRQINPDSVLDLVLWLAIAAFPAARLYYVLFSWQRFQSQPWWKVFAIWEGGIAIHGAILGGTVALAIFARRHKLPFLQLTDIVAPALILGQAIGRWGNFFNSEAFGAPTDLPWKLFIPVAQRPPGLADQAYYHPTFLYESLWNLAVFALLLRVFPRTQPGTVTALYLIGYSLGRIWIEGLRTDSLMVGPLRIAQLVSLVAIALGCALLVWQRRRAQA